MRKEPYDEWVAEEQTAITREKRQSMRSELSSAVQQRPSQVRSSSTKSPFGKTRTARLIEQRISDVDSSSDLVNLFCFILFVCLPILFFVFCYCCNCAARRVTLE